jgi:hypothetical protein
VRSGPGAVRTILLFHIISARPSKQPLMVRTFLKVYMELGSYFLFLQEQIKDIIIIICQWRGMCKPTPHILGREEEDVQASNHQHGLRGAVVRW